MAASHGSWVALEFRFTPGWPWPEDSWGLDPMFGPDGWCHSCGSPFREQTGNLVLQGNGFPKAPVWIPNWLFDAVCVNAEVAATLKRFAVEMRSVHTPRGGPTGAMQLIPKRSKFGWYSASALQQVVLERHGQSSGDKGGATCASCGQWRWLPVVAGDAEVDVRELPHGTDFVASAEIFGDGMKTFRHLLYRRELAELLASAHPSVVHIVEVQAGS